jgi:hypothetical protein
VNPVSHQKIENSGSERITRQQQRLSQGDKELLRARRDQIFERHFDDAAVFFALN